MLLWRNLNPLPPPLAPSKTKQLYQGGEERGKESRQPLARVVRSLVLVAEPLQGRHTGQEGCGEEFRFTCPLVGQAMSNRPNGTVEDARPERDSVAHVRLHDIAVNLALNGNVCASVHENDKSQRGAGQAQASGSESAPNEHGTLTKHVAADVEANPGVSGLRQLLSAQTRPAANIQQHAGYVFW